MTVTRPLAIYHEHPDWFRPLFAELERRGVPFVRLDARRHHYDPAERHCPYSLVVNRMSPSAYLRGGAQGIFYTLNWLDHLERLGVPVVNGRRAFTCETSKALQLNLLEALGLPYPRARVINNPAEAGAAAEGLRFPVVVKANIGGSGAGIVRYDTPEELARAAQSGAIDLGIDQTALVQEFVPVRGGEVTRVETLGGKYLYAIKIFTTGESYNLCPASICQTSDGQQLTRSACPATAPKSGLKVEGYRPPPEMIVAVERIAQAFHIDVGGIESFVDDRDGRRLYYDVNALSNFVADAPKVIGFDPFVRLGDYLIQRATTDLPVPSPLAGEG